MSDLTENMQANTERIVIGKYYGVCPKCGTDIEMDVQRTVCPFCGAVVDLPFRHDPE